MSETGTVVSVESGIARVAIERKPTCGKCGLCITTPDARTMHLLAQALPDTKQGDAVTVEVDRSLRWQAQFWLLTAPLIGFLFGAIAGVIVLGLSEGQSALLACGGMALAFGAGWLVDRKKRWSARPVARIVAHNAESDYGCAP